MRPWWIVLAAACTQSAPDARADFDVFSMRGATACPAPVPNTPYGYEYGSCGTTSLDASCMTAARAAGTLASMSVSGPVDAPVEDPNATWYWLTVFAVDGEFRAFSDTKTPNPAPSDTWLEWRCSQIVLTSPTPPAGISAPCWTFSCL